MRICAALSALWIKYHTHGDSLANHLGSGGVGRLNVEKLKQIAYEHKPLSNMPGSSQTDNIGLWLQMYGLSSTHRNSTSSQWTRIGRVDHEKKVAVNSSTREFFAGACLNIDNDIVVGMKKFNNCYARISFGSLKAGHALAVWLGKSNGDA